MHSTLSCRSRRRLNEDHNDHQHNEDHNSHEESTDRDMTYFLKSGNIFQVSSKEALDLHESLPVGNYVIKYDSFKNVFYLESQISFEIPKKLYGNTTKQGTRILNTFEDRNGSTGVLLTGEKGSGKTLLGKHISVEAAKKGIPTLLVNHAWRGDAFNTFIQKIDQPCVVMFDEFEKVYTSEEQNEVLTLFDGVFNSRKLFIITCNERHRVNFYLSNRPGRIYYMLNFKGLEDEFVREYCDDVLNNKTYIEGVCRVASLFDQFNFDMLKAMVEEMNRYNESPQQVLEILNAKPEFCAHKTYKIHLEINGKIVSEENLSDEEYSGIPLTAPYIHVRAYESHEGSDGEDEEKSVMCAFTNADLKQYDAKQGKYVYINTEGQKLTLVREAEQKFSYLNLI